MRLVTNQIGSRNPLFLVMQVKWLACELCDCQRNCYLSVCFSAFIVAETSDTYRFLSDENTKLQSEVSQYKVGLRLSYVSLLLY